VSAATSTDQVRSRQFWQMRAATASIAVRAASENA
jgi:hypothetical protein